MEFSLHFIKSPGAIRMHPQIQKNRKNFNKTSRARRFTLKAEWLTIAVGLDPLNREIIVLLNKNKNLLSNVQPAVNDHLSHGIIRSMTHEIGYLILNFRSYHPFGNRFQLYVFHSRTQGVQDTTESSAILTIAHKRSSSRGLNSVISRLQGVAKPIIDMPENFKLLPSCIGQE